MVNPWKQLPTHGDLVLTNDAALLHEFNRGATPAASFDLSLYPEPYFGRPDAPIVLLALNPGRGERDELIHADPNFAAAARASLCHSLEPLPFLHLQQAETTPGGQWWRRIAKPLIAAASLEAVAQSMLCVQYIAYHSKVFASHGLKLPSQQYGFHLVREAMRRGAVVVVMRSWRLWAAAIPELQQYMVHRTRNVRNPVLSQANLPDGIGSRLEALVRST